MVGEWIDGGDLWMDKARSLQLRFRDRFRVAVDRHRRRQRLTDGYFSSTMQRWMQRFRKFRTDSLPSSSVFYRKRVSMEIDGEEDSILTRMLQVVAVPVLGNVCHVFMNGLNHVQIYGAEKLHQALLHRPKNKPLITVSNHVASLDDPLVIASLLPKSALFNPHSLRWTLCATDRCFRNPATSAFFRFVKVLPVSRGDGIYQKGMDVAISKLNRGGWVHIFPEGSRSRDGGRTVGSAKRGVGRLVLDADNIPMVVPFVHTGMQEIMPIGATFPRIGKTVTVLIGDPIHFDDLLNMEEDGRISRGNLYDAVTSRIGQRLRQLKHQVDRLALEQSQDSTETESEYLYPEDDSTSPGHDFQAEQKMNKIHQKQSDSMGFSYESGMVSRIRGYMDPSELMGFAARGLFMSQRTNENIIGDQGVGPLRALNNFWKLVYDNSRIPVPMVTV
ncbi:uncharacterized protein LOC132299663 [Cornus florida]|uniref:uncharacterized protein LOC132299663 n=1 Tax=Cornus florida TaxID=4283 RepID=UPI0028A17BD2|nr:uncharacterized protein LOC132299663 [Cornus florida]